MKKTILLFLSMTFSIIAQGTAPEVSNVTFQQRGDGSYKVDIGFELYDADGDQMSVVIKASSNGGVSWAFPITMLEGFTGTGYGNGSYQVTWDFAAEHPNFFSSQMKIKVIANDGDGNIPFEMVVVPAGQYTYGENDQILMINYDFRIMKNHVTNAEYLTFIEAALGQNLITATTTTVKNLSGQELLDLDGECRIHYDGTNWDIEADYEDHPVVEVTWYGARDFAEFYGLRLPTEYEWEKAARGMTGYDYPWGNSISGPYANYSGSGDPWESGTTPAGFYNGQNYQGYQTQNAVSPFGVYDMAGNVWDWTNSIYSGTNYTIRGGAWTFNSSYCRSWYRTVNNPSYSSLYGFRCARTN
ncbi:MAG: hypothetical protein SCALA702_35820 [Melioribacteraceae bacterium]|nr:MAG: hypothetical protein SCALA702_35820 [Melioribacteraceae bacterium]